MSKHSSSDLVWKQKKVSSVMTPDPVIFHENDPLLDIIELFDSVHFEHLPICDSQNKLIGIISYREIAAIHHMLHHLSEEEKEAVYEKTASSIMKHPVLTISPEETLGEAAKIMLENHIHALPVHNGNMTIGIISSSDIIRAALEA